MCCVAEARQLDALPSQLTEVRSDGAFLLRSGELSADQATPAETAVVRQWGIDAQLVRPLLKPLSGNGDGSQARHCSRGVFFSRGVSFSKSTR
jgi:hypothetical protein